MLAGGIDAMLNEFFLQNRKDEKVLITGSSGFIGSTLCEHLRSHHYHVMGLDIKKPTGTGTPHRFEICDLLDGDNLNHVMASFQPDSVIHLGARIDLNGITLNDYAANIAGVQNLTNAIKSVSSIRRCIFTSSQLVCEVGYSPKHPEDYHPTTVYGESKVMTERIVRRENGGGVEWCIVRPTTVWGPGMSGHYQRFLKMVKSGRYFHVGQQLLYKHYGYVGNVAYQYRKLLEAKPQEVHTGTFYLADYEAIALRHWVDALQKEFGAPKVKTLSHGMVSVAAKVGDLLNTVGFKKFPFNSFRLKNVLTEYRFNLANTESVCGTLPFSVDEGVKETVKWFVNVEH